MRMRPVEHPTIAQADPRSVDKHRANKKPRDSSRRTNKLGTLKIFSRTNTERHARTGSHLPDMHAQQPLHEELTNEAMQRKQYRDDARFAMQSIQRQMSSGGRFAYSATPLSPRWNDPKQPRHASSGRARLDACTMPHSALAAGQSKTST